jgi:aminoglycoside phosphotransferase (APT) family kinase protein
VGDGIADLAQVLGLVGVRMPATDPPDLGSRDRTHVYVVGDTVVKCDDRLGSSSMIRERCALELLAGGDLPVARVLDSGQFDDTRRWIVLNRLEGEPPKDARRVAHGISIELARELGGVVARLHTAPRPPGFGTWTLGHGRTFVDEERHRIANLTRLAHEAEICPRAEIDALGELLASTIAALATRTEPVLAHRDVQPRNVLVDGGRVTALLDFESAAGGDPAEDFKVIGLDWTTPAFAAFCEGYANAGGSLGPDAPDRLLHHVLNWALVILAYLGKFAPAYLAPARTAIARARAGERPSVVTPA